MAEDERRRQLGRSHRPEKAPVVGHRSASLRPSRRSASGVAGSPPSRSAATAGTSRPKQRAARSRCGTQEPGSRSGRASSTGISTIRHISARHQPGRTGRSSARRAPAPRPTSGRLTRRGTTDDRLVYALRKAPLRTSHPGLRVDPPVLTARESHRHCRRREHRSRLERENRDEESPSWSGIPARSRTRDSAPTDASSSPRATTARHGSGSPEAASCSRSSARGVRAKREHASFDSRGGALSSQDRTGSRRSTVASYAAASTRCSQGQRASGRTEHTRSRPAGAPGATRLAEHVLERAVCSSTWG